MKYKCNN